MHQKGNQIQIAKSSQTSQISLTQALTRMWQIKVHLHQNVHQIQRVELSEASHESHTGSFKDMVNQSSFTPKSSSSPNSAIKRNQSDDPDTSSDKEMEMEVHSYEKDHQPLIKESS